MLCLCLIHLHESNFWAKGFCIWMASSGRGFDSPFPGVRDWKTHAWKGKSFPRGQHRGWDGCRQRLLEGCKFPRKKHGRNEDFPKEQEELKELRREKERAVRSGFQTMDTQGVGSRDKSLGKHSIRLSCLHFLRKGCFLCESCSSINHNKYKVNLILQTGNRAPWVPEAGLTSFGRSQDWTDQERAHGYQSLGI